MSRAHRPYPAEFRAEAVRLWRSSEKSIAELADDLGVLHQTLRNWVNQTQTDAGKRAGLTTEEKDELRQLRRKVRDLEEEREILKKRRRNHTVDATSLRKPSEPPSDRCSRRRPRPPHQVTVCILEAARLGLSAVSEGQGEEVHHDRLIS